MSHGYIGLLTLGAVFLVVTGAEALYADLGHFGRGPIQTAWLTICLPALTINYLGQGALLLGNPQAIENPFFLLYPDWALLPMIALATAATVIASQAVITGAYSLTARRSSSASCRGSRSATPRSRSSGQIYIPRVNCILLIGVLLLVVQFRSSSALASAYGIAVTGTMVVTAIMAFIVIWKYWQWPVWAAAALMVPFLLIDLTFLGANLLKVFQGGWVPLMIGGLIMIVMLTWRKGASILAAKTRRLETPIDGPDRCCWRSGSRTRSPGTAVFLTADPGKRADRAAAQPQALQGAARAATWCSPSSSRTRRSVAPADRVSIDAARQDLHPRARPLRLHGDAEHAEGARASRASRA